MREHAHDETGRMTDTFRLTLAQLNPVVGALSANAEKARHAWQKGRGAGADLVALTEMFITGYNTQDLILKPAFVADAMAHIDRLAEDCADGPALAIGGPWAGDGGLYNAYYILKGGQVAHRVLKRHLPNETVFDEARLFRPGPPGAPYSIGGIRIGSPICEDAWRPDVAGALATAGAELLLVPNGSPYYRGRMAVRHDLMAGRVAETGLPLVYLNMVGGQDDQVFDGGSFVLNPGGGMAVRMPVFEEEIRHVDIAREAAHGCLSARPQPPAPRPDEWEQDYRCMTQALCDYLAKTGFDKVLLGLSGGIDSALVAAVAVDALGPENVRCVMLPSEHTSAASLEDAEAVANTLGCRHEVVPITHCHAAVTETLAPLFGRAEPGLTEENIQSRLRGLLLMALSNKSGEMLLTTGNKSEIAVGYATIYGDMAGGYNPIKDLYKTRVFAQCRWRNATWRAWMKGPAGVVIPPRILDKPPSAELRPNQKDEDSLPPYDVLDGILERLVERDMSIGQVVEQGYERETVRAVEHLLRVSEYKRFQSAPGARLTPRAFWLDRRYPIVNRWRDQS